MNIIRITRQPKFAALVWTAVASLSACSSNKAETSADLAADTTAAAAQAPDAAAAGTVEGAGGEAAAPHVRLFGKRHAPVVKAAPFQSADGRWLNSFYFVRSPNENWESLSQLIYGRADRADILQGWNQAGTLKVGRVIYYNSAIRPEDSSNMKVLAEDYGYQLEKVEVKAGDSLSKIGGGLYGNVQTWAEIAALNPQIKNPDLIEIGQVLNIQPAQIDTQKALQQVLAAGQSVGEQQKVAGAKPAPKVEAKDPVASLEDPSTLDAKDLEPAAHGGGLVSKLIKAAVAVVALGAIGVLVKRKLNGRKNSTEAWDENANTNVTKLQRPSTGV